MPDSFEKRARESKNEAESILHVFHDQILRGFPIDLVSDKAGTGYFLSRDGSDCMIFTDNHVVANDASAVMERAQLRKIARLPADSTDGHNTVNIPLDPKRAHTTVILPDGKRVAAEPVSEIPEADGAVLRIKAADAKGYCHSLPFAPLDQLKVGELVTARGFGNSNHLQSRQLKLVGAMTVAELKQQVGSNYESLRKLSDSTEILILEGRSREGDSGGPIIDRKGQILGTLVAGMDWVAGGKRKYYTVATSTVVPQQLNQLARVQHDL